VKDASEVLNFLGLTIF